MFSRIQITMDFAYLFALFYMVIFPDIWTSNKHDVEEAFRPKRSRIIGMKYISYYRQALPSWQILSVMRLKIFVTYFNYCKSGDKRQINLRMGQKFWFREEKNLKNVLLKMRSIRFQSIVISNRKIDPAFCS